MILRTIIFLIFWGLFGYLISSCIIGPLIIDVAGETITKIFHVIITIVFIGLHCLNQSHKTHQEATNPKPEDKLNQSSKKQYLLVLSILALIMAPFGFAGMLEFKQGRELSPLLAGLLCLGSGLLLLYSWHKNRK